MASPRGLGDAAFCGHGRPWPHAPLVGAVGVAARTRKEILDLVLLRTTGPAREGGVLRPAAAQSESHGTGEADGTAPGDGDGAAPKGGDGAVVSVPQSPPPKHCTRVRPPMLDERPEPPPPPVPGEERSRGAKSC